MAESESETKSQGLRAEVIDKVAALATAAFGLVAALAWNSAIQEAFKLYFGEASALAGLVTYAVVVTIIAVLATIWIGRAAGRVREKVSPEARSRGPGRPMA